MTELSFEDLRTGDRYVITTRSTRYRVEVVDGPSRIVRIWGGSLVAPRAALLLAHPDDEAGGGGERIVAGLPLVYTYTDKARGEWPLRTETSPVVSIERDPSRVDLPV